MSGPRVAIMYAHIYSVKHIPTPYPPSPRFGIASDTPPPPYRPDYRLQNANARCFPSQARFGRPTLLNALRSGNRSRAATSRRTA